MLCHYVQCAWCWPPTACRHDGCTSLLLIPLVFFSLTQSQLERTQLERKSTGAVLSDRCHANAG